MEKVILVWALFTKRALKNFIFPLILIAFPLITFLLGQISRTDNGRIDAAICTSGSRWNAQVAESLCEMDSPYAFYLVEDETALANAVASGEAECGFLFAEDLHEGLLSQDAKRKVRVFVSPSTVMADLISETVYAEMYRFFGRELLEDTLEDSFPEINQQEVMEKYDVFRTNGSTFSFAYENAGDIRLIEKTLKAEFPIRQMGIVLMFIISIAAAASAAKDEEQGMYAAVRSETKFLYEAGSILAVVMLTGISVLLSFMISDIQKGVGISSLPYTVLIIAAYSFILTLWGSLMILLCRRSVVISGTIPFFIIASLVLCPVFLDIAVVIPEVRIIRNLLIPWHFMRLII